MLMTVTDITTSEVVLMRVFVTGASGWIASAVLPELFAAGHDVVGLARSDGAAALVADRGAEVLRGSLEDLDSLQEGAAKSDGVIHLGFIHDFTRYQHSVEVDLRAIETMGDALAGSNRPLLIASGALGLSHGRPATERDIPDPNSPRALAARNTLALGDRGVRPIVVRFPPTVHGDGDHGFIAMLIEIARDKGVSGYVDDGSNQWSAVHVKDAGRLVRLAIEHAPARSVLHAVADQGVPVRAIAELIGRHLDLPVVSIAAQDALDHFGWLGGVLSADGAASSALTRELLDWRPTNLGLVDDLDEGHYF
jgi:nucleoside-diphosphate-sugar epimerase